MAVHAGTSLLGREQHNSPQQAASNRKAFVQRLSPKEKPFVSTRLCPVIWSQWFLQTGSALLAPERVRPCSEGAEGPPQHRVPAPLPRCATWPPDWSLIVGPTPMEPWAQTTPGEEIGAGPHHAAGPRSAALSAPQPPSPQGCWFLLL